MSRPVLALDLATRTGWALRDASGRVTSGVQVFDLRRGESPGMRFLRARAWLREIGALAGAPLAVVAYERAHHRGGAATQTCVGLTTEALAYAAEVGAETAAVHTRTLKACTTGRGNCGKQAMIAAARERWGRGEDLADDNEADALCVLAWVLEEVGEGRANG